jgi:prephenate dehydratase
MSLPSDTHSAPSDPAALSGRIAFQGEPGAYSHMAAREAFPRLEPLACQTFEDAFQAVTDGTAARAMIPIENSLAGRVADIHHLLPETGLKLVGEHFLRVRHQLLGLKGAKFTDIASVHSHPMALGQCRQLIRTHRLRAVTEADTAGSARLIAQRGDRTQAALASALAAEIYGLDILHPDAEDAGHNTTRFVVMARPEAVALPPAGPGIVTAFLFAVRNVPAALYKVLGGFATNGINMTKLESYQVGGSFTATQFYAEVAAHPDEAALARAFEEMQFFASTFKVLGVFSAHPYRFQAG